MGDPIDDFITPVDFSSIEVGGGNVAIGGPYEGLIEKLTFKPAREAGKFPQISVEITATGGDIDGERTWQNLSFSPKAMRLAGFGMKAFFQLFGIEFDRPWPEASDVSEPDENGNRLVLTPDLSGEPVLFEVSDNSTPAYPKSTQTTVTAWLGQGAAQAPAAAPAAQAAPAAAAAPARAAGAFRPSTAAVGATRAGGRPVGTRK